MISSDPCIMQSQQKNFFETKNLPLHFKAFEVRLENSKIREAACYFWRNKDEFYALIINKMKTFHAILSFVLVLQKKTHTHIQFWYFSGFPRHFWIARIFRV